MASAHNATVICSTVRWLNENPGADARVYICTARPPARTRITTTAKIHNCQLRRSISCKRIRSKTVIEEFPRTESLPGIVQSLNIQRRKTKGVNYIRNLPAGHAELLR